MLCLYYCTLNGLIPNTKSRLFCAKTKMNDGKSPPFIFSGLFMRSVLNNLHCACLDLNRRFCYFRNLNGETHEPLQTKIGSSVRRKTDIHCCLCLVKLLFIPLCLIFRVCICVTSMQQHKQSIHINTLSYTGNC